jgi:hypothetical protein
MSLSYDQNDHRTNKGAGAHSYSYMQLQLKERRAQLPDRNTGAWSLFGACLSTDWLSPEQGNTTQIHVNLIHNNTLRAVIRQINNNTLGAVIIQINDNT